MNVTIIRYNPEDAPTVYELANVLLHFDECAECKAEADASTQFREGAHAFINTISAQPVAEYDIPAYLNVLAKFVQIHELVQGKDVALQDGQIIIEVPLN